MKSKININIKQGTLSRTNDHNKCRGLEDSVLIEAGSPINVGSLLNAAVSSSVS